MSLNLDSLDEIVSTDFATPLTTNLAALADGDFTETPDEDTRVYRVFVSTDAGNITLTPPTTLTGLAEGDRMVVVKVGDPNRMLFVDPITGATIRYANRDLESYTLIYDGTQWIFNF